MSINKHALKSFETLESLFMCKLNTTPVFYIRRKSIIVRHYILSIAIPAHDHTHTSTIKQLDKAR